MLFITRIPTHRNDGSEITTEERTALLREVSNIFGGFSLDGPGQGSWVDEDGRVYDEASYRLEVMCDRADYAKARESVIELGRQLDQLAMIFEVRYLDGVEIIDIE